MKTGRLKLKINLAIIGILLGLPAVYLTIIQISKIKTINPPLIINEIVYNLENNEKKFTFILTNPGEHYAILENILLEIIEYKSNEFWRFPENKSFFSEKWLSTLLEATSGPIENFKDEVDIDNNSAELNKKNELSKRYDYNVTIQGSFDSYKVFDENKKVFPKGETEEFTLNIKVSNPGIYRYRLKFFWNIPEIKRQYESLSKIHTIEKKRIHDTFKLLKNTKKELTIFSSQIENINTTVNRNTLLENISEDVIIQVLVSRNLNQKLGNKVIMVFDRSLALLEIDNLGSNEKIGELIKGEKKVGELMEYYNIVAPYSDFTRHKVKNR